MKQRVIRLKMREFWAAAQKKGLHTDTEIAAAIGISVTQVWRMKLPIEDPRHNSPGVSFIAGVLDVFDAPFEQFFFFDVKLRGRKRKVANL